MSIYFNFQVYRHTYISYRDYRAWIVYKYVYVQTQLNISYCQRGINITLAQLMLGSYETRDRALEGCPWVSQC